MACPSYNASCQFRSMSSEFVATKQPHALKPEEDEESSAKALKLTRQAETSKEAIIELTMHNVNYEHSLDIFRGRSPTMTPFFTEMEYTMDPSHCGDPCHTETPLQPVHSLCLSY